MAVNTGVNKTERRRPGRLRRADSTERHKLMILQGLVDKRRRWHCGMAFAKGGATPGDQAMSKLSTVAAPAVTLRWILQRDLPAMLQIEQQPPAPQWTQKEFKAVFQSADTAGWVADIAGRVVGFLIYRVTSQPDLVESVAADFPGWRSYAAAGQVARKPLGITLLNLAVATAWRRRG